MDNEEKKEKKIRWVERVDIKLGDLIKAFEKAEGREGEREKRLDCMEKKLGRLTGAVVGWYVFILFIGGLIGWLFKIVASIPKHAYLKLSGFFFS